MRQIFLIFVLICACKPVFADSQIPVGVLPPPEPATSTQSQAANSSVHKEKVSAKCTAANPLGEVNQVVLAKFTGETHKFFLTTPQGWGGWSLDYIFTPVSYISGQKDEVIRVNRNLINAKILGISDAEYIDSQFVEGEVYLLLLDRTDSGEKRAYKSEGEKPYQKRIWHRDVYSLKAMQ